MESPTMLVPTTAIVGLLPSEPFFRRYYILLKVHYFLFFSAFGVLYPILNITLRSRGLSNTELSYINLIIPFLVFFTSPLVGFVADHSRRYLLTFNIVVAIMTITYTCIFLVPSIKTNHIQADMTYDYTLGRVLDFCASEEVATKCSSRSECGCSYQSYCKTENSVFNFTFTMNPTDTLQKSLPSIGTSEPSTCGIFYRVPIDNQIQNDSSILPPYTGHTSPLAVCNITCSTPHFCHGTRYPQQTIYVLLYSLFFIMGTNLLMNAITIGVSIGFAMLPRPELFGQQRVWGTVGFGVSAFVASRFYKFFNTEFVYIIMFGIAAIICICITSFIHIQPQKKKQNTTNDDAGNTEENLTDFSQPNSTKEKKKEDTSRFKIAALIPLLKKIDVIIFLSLTFIWGMSYAGLDPYVYLYIDEIAPCQSHTIIGLMSLTASVSEVLALFLAGRVLKLLGPNVSSVIILLAFSIRFSGYYYIRRPYYLICMETMHFFNFGILYVLIAQKADLIAPPGLAGTLQGVVNGVSFGLGRGVGLIASSIIYTHFQPRLLFLVYALFNAGAAIIYSLCFFVMNKRSQEATRSIKNTNVPQIVIEPDTNINEEPLLSAPSTD